MTKNEALAKLMGFARQLIEGSQYYLGFETSKYGLPCVFLHRLTTGDLMLIRQILEVVVETWEEDDFLFWDRVDCWDCAAVDFITDFYLSTYPESINAQYYK